MLPGYDWLRRNLNDLNREGGDVFERNRNPVMGGAVWTLSLVLISAWILWLAPVLAYRLIANAIRRVASP